MTGKLRKMHAKNAYIGSIFTPEKYVIRVLFVSPWTSLIPPLATRVAPPGLKLQFGTFNISSFETVSAVTVTLYGLASKLRFRNPNHRYGTETGVSKLNHNLRG